MIKLGKHLPLEMTGDFGLVTFLVNKFIDRIGQPCRGVIQGHEGKQSTVCMLGRQW